MHGFIEPSQKIRIQGAMKPSIKEKEFSAKKINQSLFLDRDIKLAFFSIKNKLKCKVSFAITDFCSRSTLALSWSISASRARIFASYSWLMFFMFCKWTMSWFSWSALSSWISKRSASLLAHFSWATRRFSLRVRHVFSWSALDSASSSFSELICSLRLLRRVSCSSRTKYSPTSWS